MLYSIDSFNFRFVLQIIFLSSFLVLMYHWLFYYAQLLFFKPKPDEELKSASIIIAFKNESKNLKGTLEKLLKQTHQNFEIILVNDHSEDDYLDEIPNSSKIKLYHLAKGRNGKKEAINYGINQANHEYLLFIDADCQPESQSWISEMVSGLNNETEIILGYSRFRKENSFINFLIRFETFIVGIQYLSFAINRRAYMGVGRNMAFTKSLIKHYNDSKHADVRSGDDDLKVNQLRTKTNTSIRLSNESITVSDAKKNFKDYFFQRRRQLEAGNYYKLSDKLHLALIGLAQYFFSFSLMFALFDPLFLESVLTFVLVKVGLQLLISYFLCKKLNEKDLWFLVPLLEVVYIFLISTIGLSTWFWKVDRWK